MRIHCTEEDRKLFCQHLGKLHFPDKMDEVGVRTIMLLVESIQEVRSVRSDTARDLADMWRRRNR